MQLVKKFPTFYGTRKFITVLTSAHHLSLSFIMHYVTNIVIYLVNKHNIYW